MEFGISQQETVFTTEGLLQFKVVRCELCGKIFPSQSKLDVHSRSHSGVRPFSCEICKKGFKLKHHLQKHMMTHYKDMGGSDQ